jgi:uncharacterized protein YneF (UPF0154 family)
MIVVVIITGIITGWVVGNFILDRYINETQEEINDTQNHTKK